MFQAPLPAEYAQMPDSETHERILAARGALGRRLVILGHHYQRDEVIRHADYRGDSYKLCREAAARPEAELIVFCGVHFMAESADILTPDSQAVILPNLSAGCSLADMANIGQVRRAWNELSEVTSGVVPITYVNSAANLKAFVGEHGGSVCTSSNARRVLEWALSRGDKVLFFPDQHLGRNTAISMGFDPQRDMALWDPQKPLGGSSAERLRSSTILLWQGHCSVHMRFTVEQAEAARRRYPDVRVIVHPECTSELVAASDGYGSTEFIIEMVTGGRPGSKWAIGTEINLVKRLSDENPDKLVFCLDPIVCPCSTMYRIHPSFLCWALENLVGGSVVNCVTVPQPVKRWAFVALERMMLVSEPATSAAG